MSTKAPNLLWGTPTVAAYVVAMMSRSCISMPLQHPRLGSSLQVSTQPFDPIDAKVPGRYICHTTQTSLLQLNTRRQTTVTLLQHSGPGQASRPIPVTTTHGAGGCNNFGAMNLPPRTLASSLLVPASNHDCPFGNCTATKRELCGVRLHGPLLDPPRPGWGIEPSPCGRQKTVSSVGLPYA